MESVSSSNMANVASLDAKRNPTLNREPEPAEARAEKLEQKNPRIDDAKEAQAQGLEVKSSAQLKTETNKGTLEATLNVQLGAKKNPLALTFKAALEALNEELKPIFGDNAAEKIQESGIDVSPQATADRIVSISTGFFSRYQEQNQDMTLEDQVDSFLSIIEGGVDTGFGEARSILDGLGVLEGDIEADIDETYRLVYEGYEAFKNQTLGIAATDTQEDREVGSKF